MQHGLGHLRRGLAQAGHQPGRTQPKARFGQHGGNLVVGKGAAQGGDPKIPGIEQIAARIGWRCAQQIQQLRQLDARHRRAADGQPQNRGKAIVVTHENGAIVLFKMCTKETAAGIAGSIPAPIGGLPAWRDTESGERGALQNGTSAGIHKIIAGLRSINGQ